ncbi:DUF356 domain-containing protein [Methanobrevibacter curvatus]|uniref:DUF356 domain-containing protein n=1 Tax=Methanobrevibacter curvatus TaxID=49547 RepID=A0A166B0K3_9EURY|nr:DUF356 domain-containing protein [Methanobrevibacter curvatus]KZX12711.1 hypothetical protein MBCUR_09640 [Methanobrevibacter curvatus]
MALILIRGENNTKLLSAILDIERHANLSLTSKPKVIESIFADQLVESILKSPLRSLSNAACAFFVKEDITLSILQVKTIHPPAHVIVVSNEYPEYDKLIDVLDTQEDLDGYTFVKPKTPELMDYRKDYLTKTTHQ